MKIFPSKAKLPHKNQKGVAILLAIFTFVFVTAIAMELLENTQVEYITSAQSMNRLQAYYGAKAGAEISLLRVLMYQKARHLAGKSLGSNAHVLEKIWQFPLIWPPQALPNATIVDKELLKAVIDDSLLTTPFATSISSEGAKIDINALGSDIKVLADNSRKLVQKVFDDKLESDENFRERYNNFDFEKLLNHIADWVDEDSESKVGGDESNYYDSQGLDDEIPPNQAFKTMDELHQVEGMTDEIFELLAPHITIYGIAGINVNQASKEILMSLGLGIDDKMADEVIARRDDPEKGGPFTKLEDFVGFLEGLGLTLDQKKLEEENIPLLFDKTLNFRIVSTAQAGQTSREIVAIVYDFDRVKERVADLKKKQDAKGNDEDDNGSGDSQDESLAEKCKDKKDDEKYDCLCQNSANDEKQSCIDRERKKDQEAEKEKKKKNKPPQGRPNVVYWFEQ